jgi:hypothetical protein
MKAARALILSKRRPHAGNGHSWDRHGTAGVDPFPAFGAKDLRLAFQPLCGKPVEQSRIGQIVFVLLLEHVAENVTPGFLVGFDRLNPLWFLVAGGGPGGLGLL